MRIFKWIAGIAAGLILLIVVAVLAITLLVDPNLFKGRIEAAVRDATGYSFNINGDLDIAWYPWLAVRTGPARLGEGRPILQWESLDVGAQLIPLIRGRLVMSRIRLNGLRAYLHRAPDGHANWDALLAQHQASEKSTGQIPEIGGVEIRRGSLEYLDEREGTRLRISDWALDMDPWRSTGSFSVESRFMLQYGEEPAARIPVALRFPEIRMQSNPISMSIPKFEWRIANALLEGSMELESAAPLRASGALSCETDSLRKLLTDLGLPGPRPRDRKALDAFRMTTQWTATGDAIAVNPIELLLDQTKLNGELTRSNAANPTWLFNLRGDRIALDRYIELEDTDEEPFALPTAELRALRVQGVLSFDEAQLAGVRMKDVRLRLELEDGKLQGIATPAATAAP